MDSSCLVSEGGFLRRLCFILVSEIGYTVLVATCFAQCPGLEFGWFGRSGVGSSIGRTLIGGESDHFFSGTFVLPVPAPRLQARYLGSQVGDTRCAF